MKSTVEHIGPTRAKLSVEVPFDELKPHFDKAYRTLAGQVKVPGFRPGRVPSRIIDARVGRGAILSEVVNDAVPVKYGEAISENQLTVLGQPEIEVTRIDDGDTLAFTAEVDVRPDITLPDLESVTVSVDDAVITDEDLTEQLDALRERFATVTRVERPAAAGDVASIDLRAEVDGEALADATADGLSYTVGTGDLVDGLDEALTGLSAGESTTFTTALVAGEHAGRSAEVTVTVQSVSERVLPAADDDFAQLASEFDTAQELQADLTERIRRVKDLERGAQARDRVLEALLAAADFPAPESLVKAEVEVRQHDAVHSFDHDEEAFNAFLAEQEQTREEFDAELTAAAQEAVRSQLLLDALADAQNISVTQDEFTERLIYNAQRLEVAPDEYFKRLQDAGRLNAVVADVRRGKALAGAVQAATVTDASGEVLDVPALFGVETVSGDDETVVEGSVVDDTVVEGSVDDAVVEGTAPGTDGAGGQAAAGAPEAAGATSDDEAPAGSGPGA